MQIKWLDDLLAIAEWKNFSRAAEVRCVTQSVQLTQAGLTFCDESRQALSALLALRANLRDEKRMPGRSIQITAAHSLSMTFLPKWLAQFQLQTERFNARVVAANIHDAIIALEEGSCDLMIVYHPMTPISLDPQRFGSLALGTDAFIPVCAPDAQGQPRFRLSGSKEPIPHLAYTATTFLGRVADVVIRNASEQPPLERCYEADIAMLLVRMAVEGYGVAWLPHSAIVEELERGTLVSAGGNEWSTNLEIRYYCSSINQNPTMRSLWSALESAAHTYE